MKRLKSAAVLFAVLTILFSCAPQMKYVSNQEIEITKGVKLKAQAHADPATGVVVVKANVDNQSQEGLILVRELAVLRSPQGVSANSLVIEGPEFVLPGDKAEVVLSFVPINSRFLHQFLGWNGDLEKEYDISLDFVQNLKNEALSTNYIKMKVSEEKYKDYLKKMAVEPTLSIYQLYDPEKDLLAASLKKNIKENMPVAKPHEHEGHNEMPVLEPSIIVDGQEFFLDGVLLRISLYRKDNKGILYLKLVNRKPDEQTIDVDKIVLEANGKMLKHGVINTKSKDRSKPYVVTQNERLEMYIEYDLPEAYPELKLHLSGIQQMAKFSYFTDSITYTNASKEFESNF